MNQPPEDKQEEDQLRELLKGMTPIPFRAELASQILDQAKQRKQPTNEIRSLTRGRPRLRMTSAMAAFACVAAFLLVVWNIGGFQTSKTTSPVAKEFTTATQSGMSIHPIGLVNAPIQVTRVWTGAAQGYPAGSVVFATLTNTSSTTIHDSDIVGVLSFSGPYQNSQKNSTPSSSLEKKNPLSSDWLTFVSGPGVSIAPGQTVTWFFHPFGAPHAADGHLTEQPQVVFFQRGLVDPSQANVVWTQSQCVLTNIEVTPRQAFGTGQSIQLSGLVHNSSPEPIQLSSLLALIWFTKDSGGDFTALDAARFIDHLQTVNPRVTQVAPGQSVAVYFRLIGAKTTDFFSTTPHVSFIVRP